jgi:aspartate kinase
MQLIVQKFGGTSVGSLERIRDVAALVKKTSAHQQNIVVVSAMAGQTNKLVAMSGQLSARPLPEAYDMLLASGEQVSCALLAIALSEIGVKARPLLSFQIGIKTNDFFTNARIEHINGELLRKHVDEGFVPVVAGFQGVSEAGGHQRITTLGRGGSDTSAVALAVAARADRCDIYTDVDGVYTADPRIVPQARKIDRMSFDEMMELASLGAKVLHMRSVELAAKWGMPLRVLSTFHPDHTGSTFMKESDLLESPVVSSITSDSSECLLSARITENEARFPGRLFRPLADAGVNVDVIVKSSPDSHGHCTLSFTVPRAEGDRALALLAQYRPEKLLENMAKVSIVGIGMRTHSGVAAKMFEALERLEIPVHLITTSEIKVSVCIDESQREKAIRGLHHAFID